MCYEQLRKDCVLLVPFCTTSNVIYDAEIYRLELCA